MESPSFWDKPEEAKRVIELIRDLKGWVVPVRELAQRLESVEALLPEAVTAKEEGFVQELLGELTVVEKQLDALEMQRLMSGEVDRNNCFMRINAGAGGTEACDWAEMLARMYQRWAAMRGWDVSVIEATPGEVAGLKSISMRLAGDYAYGYAKAERGVHRLVRISPFDSNARRHTSFAAVDVVPEIAEEVKVEIRPEDLRIDTYRASGAGGQHVNRTDSAVRITHLPTNTVVSSQSDRSQIQNRETCMKMLRAILYERQLNERKKALEAMSGEKKEIAWGSQIRNYVFQPYTLVKDARTGYEVGDIQGMMDGRFVDDFVMAFLKSGEAA
jgi:peptide chain release factor 2